MIDYARMNREFPKQKARLTRARKAENARERVLAECVRVVREWDEIGCWPDNWALWQRTLDDTYPVFHAPTLDDLR